jgi:hypothetical protein
MRLYDEQEDYLLDVPYDEKDEAKAKGAYWDPTIKSWYVPSHLDPEEFESWLPPEEITVGPGVAWVYLLTNSKSCYRCNKSTSVFCIASSAMRELDDFPEYLTVYHNVTYLPEPIYRLVDKHYPTYHMDYSKQQDRKVFMNHCTHCGAKQGDFFMHSEPGGAFYPLDKKAAEAIQLKKIVGLEDSFSIEADQSTGNRLIGLHGNRNGNLTL